jgi:hypothetical protein
MPDVDEIEVTPEMIEAGIDKLYDLPELLGPSPEQLREAVRAVFNEMLRVYGLQQRARSSAHE